MIGRVSATAAMSRSSVLHRHRGQEHDSVRVALVDAGQQADDTRINSARAKENAVHVVGPHRVGMHEPGVSGTVASRVVGDGGDLCALVDQEPVGSPADDPRGAGDRGMTPLLSTPYDTRTKLVAI